MVVGASPPPGLGFLSTVLFFFLWGGNAVRFLAFCFCGVLPLLFWFLSFRCRQVSVSLRRIWLFLAEDTSLDLGNLPGLKFGGYRGANAAIFFRPHVREFFLSYFCFVMASWNFLEVQARDNAGTNPSSV